MSRRRVVIGIDPGFSGAIAVMTDRGDILAIHDMPVHEEGKLRQPDGASLRNLLAFHGRVDLVALELVHAMPKQGVATMFRFGVNWGLTLGVIQAMGLPCELVRPQDWQKAIYASQPKQNKGVEAKRATRAYVDRRWPGQAPKDGQADALCIAEWARRHQLGW
jgi:hypothetical protein